MMSSFYKVGNSTLFLQSCPMPEDSLTYDCPVYYFTVSYKIIAYVDKQKHAEKWWMPKNNFFAEVSEKLMWKSFVTLPI